ncbi:DsbA family oxidoreductase [Sphingobacterium sp.]|uniref:DsbA family oxidoreductase n=1 Tax=Sphingobacterium sp. TaxID=341027 RepID=UPI0028AA72C1|nr:DsbA family oxidoreductase [Sphingobacterium sp.]
MENKMKIEIWSDIMCPFCYIGKRNFEKALAQFPNKDLIEVEWKSFQLDPAMPEVPKYQQDMYMFVADRKGLSYEQSKRMHQDMTQYAQSVGLEYNLDKALVTNSMKGHRIIQFAKTKGLGEKAEETLFYAYFTEGKNLNDQTALTELGKEIGLTETEVNTALTDTLYVQKVENESSEAQTLGAKGVPFFVLNRKYAIAGAQHPNDILQTLEKSFYAWWKENSQTTLETIQGKSCSIEGECN